MAAVSMTAAPHAVFIGTGGASLASGCVIKSSG